MNKEKLAALLESAKKALNNAKEKVVAFAKSTKEKVVAFAKSAKEKVVAFAKSTKEKAVELWNKVVAKTKDLVAALVAWWNKLTTGAKAGVIAAAAVVVILPIVLVIVLGGNGTPTPDPAPGPTAKTYTLVVVTDCDAGLNDYGVQEVSNHVLALVYDEDGKIVDARLDCAQIKPALDENGALVEQASVLTKVEKKESYGPMPAGTWYVQAEAFEKLIIGKTAAEVAALAVTDVYAAGCTMVGTTPVFLNLVAKAFSYEYKVTFEATEDFKLGVAVKSTVGLTDWGTPSVISNFAGVVLVGDKVAAVMLDAVEHNYTIADGALVEPATPAASKNDQGDSYVGMPAGPWYKQAAAYAASAVGKTVAELANLALESDALVEAGCTMHGTAPYKEALVAAAGYAK